METFADYILSEEDLAVKMEIAYYLAKKRKIFFDKSVIFKTEIARMFLNYSKIEVDKNLVLTATLLCNCKKVDNAQDIGTIHSYAKKGAEQLENFGFGKKFCKICEEVNRYSNSNPREKESDILELVDQFGGMLLDRPERIGFKPDEAIVLLEYRNLKDKYNRYLDTFMQFVNFMEKIQMGEKFEMTPFKRLTKSCYEAKSLPDFIKEVVYNYGPKVDKLMKKEIEHMAKDMLKSVENPNRPLFSESTAQKILNHIEEKTAEIEE